MSDIPPLSHEDPRLEDLAGSLDGLGHALTARESTEPPITLIATIRASTRRRRLARALTLSGLAAALLLAVVAFAMTRPVRTSSVPLPPVVHNSSPVLTQPTMATLRALNRDSTPETLRLPSSPIGSAAAASVAVSPRDARDPESMARVLGASR